MGGRGGSGRSIANKTVASSNRLDGRASLFKKNEPAGKNISDTEQKKDIPKTGAKTQQAYIEYVKHQIGVDLSKARDTHFDNRKGFNVDTRKLSANDISAIKNLQRKYDGGYEVQLLGNGAYRIFIQVARKKRKK